MTTTTTATTTSTTNSSRSKKDKKKKSNRTNNDDSSNNNNKTSCDNRQTCNSRCYGVTIAVAFATQGLQPSVLVVRSFSTIRVWLFEPLCKMLVKVHLSDLRACVWTPLDLATCRNRDKKYILTGCWSSADMP